MTLGEYRVWVDGFREGLSKAPNKEELKKMLAKLDDVSDSECCHNWPWNTIYSPFYASGTYTGTTTNIPITGNDWTTTNATGNYITPTS